MTRRTLLQAAFAPKPKDMAESLAQVYGQTLSEVVYIQSFALLGHLQLGHREHVETLVAPFVDGSKDSLAKATASHCSGHLLFAELALLTNEPVYAQRVVAAAQLAQLPFYNEMSDGIFMGCPILAAAGRLTGRATYYNQAVEQLQAQQKYLLRSDGLYRHSPLCDAAWGRGNAFAALGMHLMLRYLNRQHSGYAETERSLQALLNTLRKHQTKAGLWRQVIDHPTAYEEYSATAMLGSILNDKRARKAILARTRPSGEVTDVCESTGKQRTLEAYLQRKAISGRDPRGGAMALFFLS
jgi:unsaturated rhamnogalacturonyl hydrolase